MELKQSTQNAWLRPAEIFEKIFEWPFFQSLQKPGRFTLVPFTDQVWLPTDISSYFQVFFSNLLLIFSYSSMSPWFWGKTSISCDDLIGFLISKERDYLLLNWGKIFKQSKQSTFSGKLIQYQRIQSYILIKDHSFLPFIHFPWRET